MTAPDPVEFRLVLAELFAEAENRWLGTLTVGFTAMPGREDAAADYIGARAGFLAEKRLTSREPGR